MNLKIPNYIEKTGVAETPITHICKRPDDYYYEVPKLFNKWNPLQSRSILAITLGCAEWVFWRLSKNYNSQPDLIKSFLEAGWAAAIDRRYMNYLPKATRHATLEHYKMSDNPTSLRALYKGNLSDDIKKTIEGPVLIVISALGVVINYTVPQNSNTTNAIYVSNVAEAVCNEKIDAFKAWRRAIIQRHYEFHRKSPEDYLGVPVPRESIDPDFDYHPSKNKELINNFLSNLDFESNPFLTHPDELKELGFEGKPYVYEGA